MSHQVPSFDPMRRSLAQIQDIPTEQPYRWLAAGFRASSDLHEADARER
jgi:hypothetical protein